MSSSRTSTPPQSQRSQSKLASMPSKQQPNQDARKQIGLDQSQSRKPSTPTPNAWTKGSTNPVTQRPVGQVTNGATSSPSKDSSLQDRSAFLFANFKGCHTTLTTREGIRYTGIFSSSNLDPSDLQYTLKMVRKITDDSQVNGASDSAEAYVGNAPNFTKVFPAKDVVSLDVSDVRFDHAQKRQHQQNGASKFRTDTDISGASAARERTLTPWAPSADDSNDALSLDSSSGGTWDQFAANEKLFGLKTNYDESFYTTTINRSHPEYQKRAAEAEKLAREIEGQASANAHVAEERNQKDADEVDDEEAKYSGVHRTEQSGSGQPNKYMPPARRPPSGQPTVPGAPVDPAIISSALAKDDKAEESSKEASKPDSTPAKANLDKVIPSSSKSATPSKEGGATGTVEKDVVNAFKNFHANEKLRISELQRQAAKRDKNVKINDLKKFAQMFKLHTPVPQDLVPILAKDKDKQEKIVKTAQKNAEDFKVTKTPDSVASPPPPQEPKIAKPAPKPAANQPSPQPSQQPPQPAVATPNDRQNQRNNGRQNPPNYPQGRNNGAQQGPPPQQRPHPSQLSQNLRGQYPRPPMNPMASLQDPRIDPNMMNRMPPTGPAMQAQRSQSQFMPKAPEFRPNPSAHSFQPVIPSPQTAGSSPSREPRRPHTGSFWALRRPLLSPEERILLSENYNIINTLIKQAKEDKKDKENNVIANGGIIRTWVNPIWEGTGNGAKTYAEVFERPVNNGMQQQMPHHHQLPMQLQGGMTPQQTPRHHAAQPHHYDDHRMQHTYSNSSMHHSSPRSGHNYMVPGQAPVPNMYGQPTPGYGMPGGYPMTMRQVSGGPQMMSSGPAMGGHMMAQQASSGPYMNHMSPQPYGQMPTQGYPHNGMHGQGGPQGFSSSPRPPHSAMMIPQGSQQGHQVMYMPGQPSVYPPQGPVPGMRPHYGPPQHSHYGTSPHQVHQYPQQTRGTPSAHYVQPMMQPQAAHMPPGGMVPPSQGGPPPVDGVAAEDGK